MGHCRAGADGLGGEAVRRRYWLGLLAIPATFGIGVSCGLPFDLFLRASRGDASGI